LRKKQFVVSVGSDAWVSDWRSWLKGKFKGFGLTGRFIYELDIRLANVVIVMNEWQRTLLKKNFGKDGLLIKHHVPLTARAMPEKARPPIVLWVGTMAEVKQPELFVKLAEAIPEARFQMIGGHSGNQEFYDKIKANSERISNFEFLGVVPFREINQYFSRASILVNTSMFEAFPPHAFIQAWMHYVPVVSLNSNPDKITCRYNMGFHSKTFDQLIEDVKTLLKDEILWKEMGMNGRAYVETEHDIKKVVKKYIEIFEKLNER
jgi:glycosyltransferase involved in cell wall biosynthesis